MDFLGVASRASRMTGLDLSGFVAVKVLGALDEASVVGSTHAYSCPPVSSLSTLGFEAAFFCAAHVCRGASGDSEAFT